MKNSSKLYRGIGIALAGLLVVGAVSFAAAASAPEPNQCGETYTYTFASNDHGNYGDDSSKPANIDYINTEAPGTPDRVTVTADAGFEITKVELSVDDDGNPGFVTVANGPVTNLNPSGSEINVAKVTVKKVCPDVCPNIDGDQYEVPEGLILSDGQCIPPPPTLCTDELANNAGQPLPCTYTMCQYNDQILASDPLCVPPPPTCSDGIQNQDETGVDTGGVCTPPPTLCEDQTANNVGQPLPCTYTMCEYNDQILASDPLCVPPPIYGCTNPDATNYNPEATVDDQSCVFRPTEDTATLHAQKIICDDESDLPNWGDHQEPDTSIGASTAGDYVASHEGCRLADWEFEWSYGGVENPGDNLVGSGGAGWNAFTGGLASVDLSNDPSEIHVREIPQEGYIPFVGAGDESDVSAEIYCSNDVLHYDNFDFVRNPQADTDYYCVAWNVSTEEPTTTDVTICKYDDEQNPLSDWTVMLLGDFVENVNVPSNGTEAFSSVLTNGDPYALIANGTYVYRPGAEGDISDPAFTKRSYSGDPIDPTGQPYEPWYDVNDLPGFPGYLGIAVDGDVAGTNWSDIYNSLHTYALGYTGTGAGAGFKIVDNVYPDNSGSLNVDVYEGYVGTTGENGCVTFEDVPFGGYTLDEILQDGWTNVSGKDTEVIVGEKENHFTLVNTEGDGCLIEGYKYDEEGNPLEGWTIGLASTPNNEFAALTSLVVYDPYTTIGEDITDENGYYCIPGNLEEKDVNYYAYEVMQDGWEYVKAIIDLDENTWPVPHEMNGKVYVGGIWNPPQNQVDFYNTDKPICDPEVNLITNGGFESPLVTLAQQWELFPGGGSLAWLVDWMTGGSGNLELQSGVNGWLPYEGEQYAELDSHGNAPGSNVKIYQDLDTEDDEAYELSFAFSPRPGTNSADNQFEVWWNGSLLDTITGNNASNNTDWDVYTYELTGEDTSTLEFRAIGTQNTLGTFIDDVGLYCVPEEEEHHNSVTVCKYEVNDEEGENNPGMPGWTVGLNEDDSDEEWEYEGVTGKDGCITFTDVKLDQYTVEEKMQDNWEYFSGAGDGQVWNIDSDQGKYTFNLINRRTDEGSITIDKIVVNGSQDEGFSFDLSWLDQDVDAVISGADEPETFSGLSAGIYTLEELTENGDDWYVTNVECTPGTLGNTYWHDPGEGDVEINLHENEDVTCTFTNTYRSGGDDDDDDDGDPNIIVRKEVTEGSDTNTIFEFDPSWSDNFSLDAGQQHDSGNLMDLLGSDFEELNPFSVSEILPDGWTLVSVTCDSNLTEGNDESSPDEIDLENGETVTCTFLNDQNDQNSGDDDDDDDDDDGGGSSFRRRESSSSDGGGEVLGEQISLVPLGAPNTGRGGVSMCLR